MLEKISGKNVIPENFNEKTKKSKEEIKIKEKSQKKDVSDRHRPSLKLEPRQTVKSEDKKLLKSDPRPIKPEDKPKLSEQLMDAVQKLTQKVTNLETVVKQQTTQSFREQPQKIQKSQPQKPKTNTKLFKNN
jgi:hypothetical protein